MSEKPKDCIEAVAVSEESKQVMWKKYQSFCWANSSFNILNFKLLLGESEKF